MKVLNKNIYSKDFIPPIIPKLYRQIKGVSEEDKLRLLRDKVTPPPPKLKQNIVKEYKRIYRINTFVETGTHFGDMVNAVKKIFTQIYSIELFKELYERAQEWFSEYNHIHLINGDSGKVLADVIKQIKEPCLFWLDAHYSGKGISTKGELNTPIIKELKSILSRSYDDVILIDDARFFIGLDDYPTINNLEALVARHHPNWVLCVREDIIRIHKNKIE